MFFDFCKSFFNFFSIFFAFRDAEAGTAAPERAGTAARREKLSICLIIKNKNHK